MKNLILLTAIALIQITSAQAGTQRFFRGRMLQLPVASNAPRAQAQNFDQRIDHFNGADTRTFQQRYFLDSTYAKGANAPVLYYFCGEAVCEGATGTPEVDNLAKKYGAHRVALEHRFYGYSIPLNSLDSNSLTYLSMDQAIEDLADFQRFATSSLGLKGKWISIGGSYAGELSAFYRMKHPELVVGALASSAPVLSKANFEEYDHYVAKVAGTACLADIKAAVSEIETALANGNAAQVKGYFQLENDKDDVDFLYVVADMAAAAVQYGFQKTFCSSLSGSTGDQLVQNYAKAGISVFAQLGETPIQDSFETAMNTDPAAYQDGTGMRSWMYQSCTEFGYYQVAYHNPAESSRSQRITLDYHNQVCNHLFGLTTPVNDNATNAKFYNNLFAAGVNNIFFTNGSNDPWSNLSLNTVTAAANPALKLFTIAGAAHCDDMGSRMSAALTEARTDFDAMVRGWLAK